METKPGIKSTEFWNIPIFVAVLVANGTEYVNIPPSHIALLATLMFGYGAGTQIKKYVLAKNGVTPISPNPTKEK